MRPKEPLTFCLALFLAILCWETVATASIDNKANDSDRLLELQEEMKARYRELELLMEAQIGALTKKVEMLEATIQEQNIMARTSSAREANTETLEDSTTSTISDDENLKQRLLYPKTCYDARASNPSLTSGMYWIDPDGQGRGDEPIYVYCNMSSGSTSILHDSEDYIEIGSCFEPGCYSKQVKYDAPLRQLAMLSEFSEDCHQSIEVECYDSAFEFNGLAYSWWDDRNGDARYFWAGENSNATSHYHMCQCGLDGNCKDKSLYCNCDSDLAIKLSDIGTINEKALLPITKLNFGRTVVTTNRFKLGRLTCNGKSVLKGMPSSCYDLWLTGYTLSGFYLINGPINRTATVYCDFSRLPGDEKLQTWIGYVDTKTTIIYSKFVAGEQISSLPQGSMIPFEKEIVNIGNAFNTSGMFTAPQAGAYLFHIQFITQGYSNTMVVLKLNENQSIGSVQPQNNMGLTNGTLSVLHKMDKGDQVHAFLYQGLLISASFTCSLISEDILAF